MRKPSGRRTWHTLFLILLFGLGLTTAADADTLRVVSYNVLNFRGEADADRIDDFRTVMRSIRPDVAVVQEMISEDGVDAMLSFVLLQLEDDWAAAPFNDGPDTDNALFYRTSKVRYLSQRIIPTSLRDIAEYTVQPVGADSTERLKIYSLHLKASQGYEERRRQEAAVLRQNLNQLPATSLHIVCGDYNLYGASEPAYELLLDPQPDTDGQLFDPIDEFGEWHTNPAFADVHTQSVTTDWGGLDDRFDFILASAALMDPEGSHIIVDSYAAYGNDGRHFNQNVNNGINYAVPDSVADALYVASDHLPVVVNLVLSGETAPVPPDAPQPSAYRLLNCYPNPFNSTLNVEVGPVRGTAMLQVFDILGRRVFQKEYAMGVQTPQRLALDFSTQSGGTYFVRLRSGAGDELRKVLYLR